MITNIDVEFNGYYNCFEDGYIINYLLNNVII